MTAVLVNEWKKKQLKYIHFGQMNEFWMNFNAFYVLLFIKSDEKIFLRTIEVLLTPDGVL